MPTLIANVALHSRRRVATISLLACLTLCSCRAIEMSLPADTRVNNATASSATTTSTTSADDPPLTTAVAARPSPVELLVQTSAGFAPVVAAPHAATNAGLLIPNRGSDQLEPTTLTGATGPPEIAPASLLAPCPNCAPRSVWGQGLQQAGDPCLPASVDQQWPNDEYLCDGGDQGTRVAVNRDWNVSGLDLEDTVAHYDTLEGQTVVTPSNSVCIYAPRFAAVRQIVYASEEDQLLVSEAIEQPLPAINEEGTSRASLVDLPLPPQRERGLAGPIAVRHRTRGLDLIRALPVHELNGDFAAHEDFQVIRLGIHQSTQRAAVQDAVDAAIQWTEAIAPEIILDETPAEIDVTVEKIGTEYHLGAGKPRLRVIKLASTGSALPGEEVTFTLRFDNTGEQSIGNVTILDNLTTRLEYVPDSAECSMKAEFFQNENQGESLALRWEIRDPVRPGEGGIIRFRCKVR